MNAVLSLTLSSLSSLKFITAFIFVGPSSPPPPSQPLCADKEGAEESAGGGSDREVQDAGD